MKSQRKLLSVYRKPTADQGLDTAESPARALASGTGTALIGCIGGPLKFVILTSIFLISGFAQAQVAAAPPVLAPTDPAVAACLNPPPAPKTAAEAKKEAPVIVYEKANPEDLPKAPAEGSVADFQTALKRQLANCHNQAYNEKQANTFRFACHIVRRAQWCVDSNQKMLNLSYSTNSFPELMQKIRSQFDWYKVTQKDPKEEGDTLFTAYNNPDLELSERAQGEYKYPIYRAPDDLVEIPDPSDPKGNRKMARKQNADGSYSEYMDRAAIEKGGLDPKYIIGYAKSPLDIVKLQVEGSGLMTVHTPDGKTKKIQFNYAGQNGRKSYLLSKLLRCRNLGSLNTDAKQREYFKDKPEELSATLNLDRSYVFFSPTPEGPKGSTGAEIVGRHSIATDPTVIPTGMAVLISTNRPEEEGKGQKAFSNLSIAQDVGGAIKGLHVDTYWGSGPYAAKASNTMKSQGSVFIPMPPDAKMDPNCVASSSASASSAPASGAK